MCILGSRIISGSKPGELVNALRVCNSKQMLYPEPQQVWVITLISWLLGTIVGLLELQLVEDAEFSQGFHHIFVARSA